MDENGLVCDIKVVLDDEDIMMIACNGVIIRMQVSDISVQSRYAQGVRVMRVEEGEQVVTIAKVAHEEEEAEASDNIDEQEEQE